MSRDVRIDRKQLRLLLIYGFRYALGRLARELELALALTKDGLQLDPHTSGTVQGVEIVKRALRGEEELDDG